MHFHIKLRRL